MKKKLIILLSVLTSSIILVTGCGKYTQEDMDVIELEKTQLQNAHDNLSEMYSELKAENEALIAQIEILQAEVNSQNASTSVASTIDDDLLAYYISILSVTNDYLEGTLSIADAYEQISDYKLDLFLHFDKTEFNPVESEIYDKVLAIHMAMDYLVQEDYSEYSYDSLLYAISQLYQELSESLNL